MTTLPVTRVVLYKHGVGYFERQTRVEADATLTLTFKQREVSDVLKSLTVLDLDGGHVASVSYDATKPLDQLLADVDLTIPDQNSLVGLLPQLKGARIAVRTPTGEQLEGLLLGVDTTQRDTPAGVVQTVLVSLLTDLGAVRSFDLHGLANLEVLDPALRRDLEFYLRTLLSAKKKDARTFTFFAQGEGPRRIRISYTLEAPVWKATYRILLAEEGQQPLIQGWAVVDNTQDEDWEGVQLSLVAGLPVSFIHDLYTPRYIRRPVVQVQETTGVLPPTVEEGMLTAELMTEETVDRSRLIGAASTAAFGMAAPARARRAGERQSVAAAASSMPAQVRERKLGDLFEYEIEHPVTIRRNQAALVPIVLRHFAGRPVLLHNRDTRATNPMRCVELKNTMGLTLEGGPVTVLEGGSYVGEAMLDTLKPDEERLIPYAVELSVSVLDNVESFEQRVEKVVIKDKVLTTYRGDVRQTTYHFHNKSDQEQTLYLDHPRGGSEWSLADTPAPHETTENYWRFRFTLPAKKVTAFVVQQRKPIVRKQGLMEVNAQLLALWLEQRYLDPRSEEALREILALQARVGALDAQLVKLGEERDNLRLEQGRIRENMLALGDRSAEKELRERFVRTLSSQEDRLEQIAVEVRTLTDERQRTQARVSEMLGGIQHEVVLG